MLRSWKVSLRAVTPVAALVGFARPNLKCEVSLQNNAPPHSNMNLYLRLLEDAGKMRAHKAKQARQVCAARDAQAALQETIAGLKNNARVAEVEKVAYEKTIKKKEEEIRHLRSAAQLQQLLDKSQSRVSVMLSDFKPSAPTLDDFNCKQLAQAIDNHDCFDDPNSLNAAVQGGTLVVHFRGAADTARWRLWMQLPSGERDNLLAAVHRQIGLQRQTFAKRREFQAACEKHLRDGPCSLPKIDSLRSVAAKRAELKHTRETISQKLQDVFLDLKKQGTDVKSVLLEQWMPVALQRALVLYGELCVKEADLKGEAVVAEKHNPQVMALMLNEFLESQWLQEAQS